MPDYGVTPTGFVYKPYTVIYNDLVVGWRANFGADLDVSIDTPNGQLTGLFAAPIAEIWQQMNAVYDAYNPNAAYGISLTNIGVITYTPRQTPGKSTGPAIIVGTPGTFIPMNIARIFTQPLQNNFRLLSDVTIPPSGTITVQAEALDDGPILAPAGTLTGIATPIDGWTSVNNTVDVTPGRNVESDPIYRIRRNNSAAIASQNVEDALNAALKALPGVLDAVVLVNSDNTVDGNGFAPNSIAVVVEGGEDQDIINTIYGRKTSGIPTNGDILGYVNNNAGLPIPIRFYRQQQVTLYITIEVEMLNGFPVDGLAQIQQNVYDYLVGTNNGGKPVFNIGDDVIISKLYTPINLTDAVSVISIAVDDVFPPINTANFAVTFQQLATFDIDNIQVIGI
jgi:uncharacterized phage protein gp47/JayE